MITVVVPVYNSGKYIFDTIKSIQNQTYSNYKCIIVDDGSTDNTHQIICNVAKKDSRFQIIRQENRGECAARNTGIAHVTTEYITVLDSDDIWHPEFLQDMMDRLHKPGVKLAWCHFAMFYDGSTVRKPQPWDNVHKTGNIWWDMLCNSEFCMGAWAARTDVVRKAGPFDISLRVAGDRDFALRLLALICQQQPEAVQEIPRELLFYRQRAGSSVRNAQAALDTEWDTMRKHIEHTGIPSRIRKRAWSFLAFKMAVIASFGAHKYAVAIRWYIRAFFIDPLNMNLYWLPLRKIFLKLKCKESVNLP